MNTRAIVPSLCVLLAGCASISPPLEPGLTTRDQVVARYGPPSREWRDDGAVTLEYATQPRGVSCFMFSFDAQERLTNGFDALSERGLARVRPDMREAEVERLLGRHARETYFPLSGETVWDWNVPSLGPALATLFHVHFKEGRVVRTSRTFVMGKDGDLVFHNPAYFNCPRCTPP